MNRNLYGNDTDSSTTTTTSESESEETLFSASSSFKKFLIISGFICSCGVYEYAEHLWLTYFNPFLQITIGLKSSDIGTIVLIAQIVDAISNPLVGLLIQYLNIPVLGNKKGCHLIGSALITLFFPFLWMNCWFCSSESHNVIYYSVIAALMNALTPLIFLPHLSMIAILSKNDKERVLFGGISSFSKQFWGILAYMTMWILIGSDKSKSANLGELLSEKLQTASYIVTAIGIISTVYFHVSVFHVKESQTDDDGSMSTTKDWRKLLKSGRFYIESIAYLPFIYLSVAGLGSIMVRLFSKHLKPIVTFYIAMVIVVVSGLGFIFQPEELGNVVILGVVVFSLGSGIMYTLSLFFTSNLIVNLNVSDVTVWGTFNFVDRVLFGVAFAEIQKFRPCPASKTCCDECSSFYRYIFGGGIIIIALLAGVLMVLHQCVLPRQPRVAASETNLEVVTSPEPEIFTNVLVTKEHGMKAIDDEKTSTATKAIIEAKCHEDSSQTMNT